jgi:hypothetical protein
MQSLKWFGLAAVLSVLIAVPVWAARAPAAPAKGSKEAVEAEAALMISECKFTAEQQETFKAKVKEKLDALEAWTAANADKLKAAEDASKAARTSTDQAVKKKASDDLKALDAARTSATAKADAAILAVLTAEQKQAWEGVLVYQAQVARYKKVNPTEEQLARIKAACAAAGRDMADARAKAAGDDRAEKKAKTDLDGKLRWAIETIILTAEQREAVTKKPAPKAAPAAAPAPAAESK